MAAIHLGKTSGWHPARQRLPNLQTGVHWLALARGSPQPGVWHSHCVEAQSTRDELARKAHSLAVQVTGLSLACNRAAAEVKMRPGQSMQVRCPARLRPRLPSWQGCVPCSTLDGFPPSAQQPSAPCSPAAPLPARLRQREVHRAGLVHRAGRFLAGRQRARVAHHVKRARVDDVLQARVLRRQAGRQATGCEHAQAGVVCTCRQAWQWPMHKEYTIIYRAAIQTAPDCRCAGGSAGRQ